MKTCSLLCISKLCEFLFIIVFGHHHGFIRGCLFRIMCAGLHLVFLLFQQPSQVKNTPFGLSCLILVWFGFLAPCRLLDAR